MSQDPPAANLGGASNQHNPPAHQEYTETYRDDGPRINEPHDARREPTDDDMRPLPPQHGHVPQQSPSYQHLQSQRQYGIAPGSNPDGSQNQWRQQSQSRNLAPGASAGGYPKPPSPQRQPNRSPPHEYGAGGYYGSNGRNNAGMAAAAAGGAGAGVAMGGPDALRDIDNWGRSGNGVSGTGLPPHMDYDTDGFYGEDPAMFRPNAYSQASNMSSEPLSGAATGPGMGSPGPGPRPGPGPGPSYPYQYDGHSQDQIYNARPIGYSDNPYRHSSYLDPRTAEMGGIDPTSIEDDGDDGLQHANPARRSVLSLGRSRQSPATSGLVATGAAGAAAGGVLAASKAHDGSGGQGPETPGEAAEKSEWLSQQQAGKKKQRWIITVVVVLVILAIIAGAVVGGILGSQKANKNKDPASDGGTNGQTAAEDDASGDLSKDSKEIKALLNNPDLHRVFPGMDYTPLNSQYPDCLVNPPSQNNVTRDVAVLSQLSNKLRMYGTDCNQTQLVLHAIDRLALKDMKVWLGVWLDTNQTTNDRQMSQMWDILDEYGDDPFEGLVVGNEILFRKDMTESQLGLFLQNVKSNLTSKGVKLPLATSDLGSSWTTTLATYVDVIMSNIHPFFGGVAIDVAASWTWTFWQENDIPASAGTNKRQIISEVGWPSEGGNDCAPNPKCSSPTAGAVAGIPEMNQFMNDWVCQALKNGTEYYWFEAFDEPWKIRFNTEDQQWEDKWGLMDVNRNLKPGVKIPDCGGQTV